jgi:Nif-specific regulatory protein
VERNVDVRIVAATNRDLEKMVHDGAFRQDLYYRLRVFPINLPPLRERPEDIQPLCELFAARFSGQLGKPTGGLDPSLVETLRGYAFPGNVRELANEIERAVVRAEPGDLLSPELLSEELLSQQPPVGDAGPRTLRDQLADVERRIISEILRRHDGRKIPAAKELGLTRQGLAKKMDRLGLK